MKRVLLIFSLLLPTLLSAQNFYWVHYTGQGGNKHKALVVYLNDQKIIVRHLHDSSGDLYVDRYSSNEMENASGKSANLTAAEQAAQQNRSAQDVDLTVWAAEDQNAPVYLWYWDSQKSEEEQAIPYVSFSLQDVVERHTERWVKADSFKTLQLADMSDEVLNSYFKHDNPKDLAYYNKIRDARDQARRNSEQLEKQEANATLALQENLPTLHLFELTNNVIEDIGRQCDLDSKKMHNEMRGVAKTLGINIKEYDVAGKDFNFNQLRATLKQMKVGSDDVIIFHYSGHGFRFDDQEDPFPQLSLCATGYEDLLNGNYVSLMDIYEVLLTKKARLCLVLADCCNSKVGMPVPITQNVILTRDKTNYQKEQLELLFLRSSGSLLSSAASPGELSWCDMQGGMYTNAFIQALHSEISLLNKEQASWENIIDQTIVQANSRSTQLAKTQNGLKKAVIKK